MNQFSHYCVLKTYKGIFRKKHSGNVQLFVTSTGSDFMALALLGLMDDDINVAQLLTRGPSQYMEIFLSQMKEDENFMILDSLKVNSKEKSKGVFSLSYPKKGNHIKSDLKIEFESEYSRGNSAIYSIHGKLELVFDEPIGEKEIGMKAIKKKALFKSSLRNKILKGE